MSVFPADFWLFIQKSAGIETCGGLRRTLETFWSFGWVDDSKGASALKTTLSSYELICSITNRSLF